MSKQTPYFNRRPSLRPSDKQNHPFNSNSFVSNESGTVRYYHSLDKKQPSKKTKKSMNPKNIRPTPCIPNAGLKTKKLKTFQFEDKANQITSSSNPEKQNCTQTATSRESSASDKQAFIKNLKSVAVQLGNLIKLTSFVGEVLNEEMTKIDLPNPKITYTIGKVHIRNLPHNNFKNRLSKKRPTFAHLAEPRVINSSCADYQTN